MTMFVVALLVCHYALALVSAWARPYLFPVLWGGFAGLWYDFKGAK